MEWRSTEDKINFDKADWQHLGNLRELMNEVKQS